ncbi:phosphate ABC transporter permease subunit PstC [Gorillibacterium timonense]|uniref:phosphate ABC transporter permease subunit PstC n=1 Tax=Gorillibacterium timonense TaxID=1689269 RepID=UPI000A9B2047|nr:phosphate ABC transporter permease subunit PstC [Gorillibacterium timonense]
MNKQSQLITGESGAMAAPARRSSSASTRKKRVQAQNAWFGRYVKLSIFSLCFVLAMVLILVGKTGLSTFASLSPADFFFSLDWTPEEDRFGAGSLIIGTLLLTFLTLLISVPVSVGIAVFLSEICPSWMKRIYRSMLDILVGIPSVVYGYLGLTVLLPIIRQASGENLGDGLLAASLVLSLMILPTISRVSDDALTAVPGSYREAAYALGSTRLQAIVKVILPCASRGILSAIILGMARAIGETMAVVMVIGNTAQLPRDLVTPTSVLTSTIVMQISNVEFTSTWSHALYMMAFLLLVISLGLIILLRVIRSKGESQA